MANQPVVAVLMGSKSDLPVVEGAFKVFDEFGIPYEAHAMSAHRTPVEASEPFNGLDALFSIVQMPPGIPVAAVTAGKAGGKNAALYAVSILALGDAALAEKLKEFRRKQTAQVLKADAELQEELNRR